MLSIEDLKSNLVIRSKDCDNLYQYNNNLQAQFVNILQELQQIKVRLEQVGSQSEVNGTSADQVQEATQSLHNKQQVVQNNALAIYDQLKLKRQALLSKLRECVQSVALLQNDLLNKRLFDWKQNQKVEQYGAAFDEKDEKLNEIQADFQLLAEQCWNLRTRASWLQDLLVHGPQVSDQSGAQCAVAIKEIVDHVTKLLVVLVSQSFIVSMQPDSVLKTNHKFTAAVRLLIGDRLGVKQQLDNAKVTVRIVAEEQARQLYNNKPFTDEADVGSIMHDTARLLLDESGHLSASFSNTKLSKIAPRKPATKGGGGSDKSSAMATDQKYALLFKISQFELTNLGKFDLWTLSLPLMVTVHGSQDCDAQATILWQRAFGSVNWSASAATDEQVSWSQLRPVLAHKFIRSLQEPAAGGPVPNTNIRPLGAHALDYLAEKLYNAQHPDYDHAPKISFQRFAKQHLREDVPFSFWEWYFAVMQLIKQKLLVYWNQGWLCGFVSKEDAAQMLVNNQVPSFLLRFSDQRLGAVSIAFVCFDDTKHKYEALHLAPFVGRELDQLSLVQRIATCPHLQQIKYIYPDQDKELVLRKVDKDDKDRHRSPPRADGYVASEVIMVATGISNSNNASGSQLDQVAAVGSAGSPLYEESSPFMNDSPSATISGFGNSPAPISDDILDFLIGPNFGGDQLANRQLVMPELNGLDLALDWPSSTDNSTVHDTSHVQTEANADVVMDYEQQQ